MGLFSTVFLSLKGPTMYCMSEEEKEAQVGKLALEYSEVKGRLNHIEEKLQRFLLDCKHVAHPQGNTSMLRVVSEKPVMAVNPPQPPLDNLLSTHELVDVLEERERMKAEVAQFTERIRAVAPHLL
jgi:hypothetical protein